MSGHQPSSPFVDLKLPSNIPAESVYLDPTILALEGARSYTAARFEHGLLVIELRREVPEALKPRRIEIATASGQASVAQNNVTTLDQSKVA